MPIETHTLKLTITLTPSEDAADHLVFETTAGLGIDDACNPSASATTLLAQAPSVRALAELIGDAMDDLGLSCNPE